MKTTLIAISLLLLSSFAVSAQSPQLFNGCGVLHETSTDCLLFYPEGDTGPYVLDRYDGFVSGDTVNVIGIVDPSCIDCSAECLHNISISACSGCCVGMRGDLNQDGTVDISDLMCLIAYAFHVGEPCFDQLCIEMLDLNGDGTLDISDFTYLVKFMFGDGPAPVMCP